MYRIFVILVVSILLAGCLENNPLKSNDIEFDITPEKIEVKNNEKAELKIRVANNGNSIIHASVRFNMNSSDKQYVDFVPESYDTGTLRPGEDSGFRIVELKARLAAGAEVKYSVRAEVINNGSVLEYRDILITVVR